MLRFFISLSVFLAPIFLSLSPYQSKAMAFQLMVSKNAEKSMLAGRWKVSSKVVWSDCPYVRKGVLSETEIDISDINGTLYPNWKTEDWTLVRNNVIDFNADKSLYWERESKLYEESDLWFVKSINKFHFSDKKGFIGKSHHKQYLNGEYVGAYITMSQLERIKDEPVVSLVH